MIFIFRKVGRITKIYSIYISISIFIKIEIAHILYKDSSNFEIVNQNNEALNFFMDMTSM